MNHTNNKYNVILKNNIIDKKMIHQGSIKGNLFCYYLSPHPKLRHHSPPRLHRGRLLHQRGRNHHRSCLSTEVYLEYRSVEITFDTQEDFCFLSLSLARSSH